VFVNQVADDFLVSAIKVMRIQEDVECLHARWTVSVRSSVYIDIHSMRQYFERGMLLPILCIRGDSDA